MARPRRSDPRQRQFSLGAPLGDPLNGIMVRAAFSEVARLIGLDETETRFLKEVWERRISDPECYRSFGIPKKSGGTRVIDAPYKALRLVQKYIHRNFLTPRVPPSPICHSFVGTQMEARALARIRGAVGFCYMVYGEDLPPRLWNWSREIRLPGRLTDLTLSAILETVKRDPPVEEIHKAMSAAAGY